MTRGSDGGNAARRWLLLGMLLLATQAPAAGLESCGEALRIFEADMVLTMEPALPKAGVVAVRRDCIVAVGRDLDDLRAWTDQCPFEVDDRFADAVLMRGLIDPHLYPMLTAILARDHRQHAGVRRHL